MRGQSVVMVAVVLLGLVGFVALAVDGARLYAEKAQMQTAADAGALAGSYQACGDKCSKCAKMEAERFALLNGARDVKVFIRGKTVTVEASVTVRPFFAGLLGVRGVEVGAGAAASCGRLME